MSYGAISNSQALSADVQSLGALKLEAGKNSKSAIKSMREATMKSGMLDSPGGDLGTDLLDQQFAVQMSGKAGGLSDLIEQQLTRQMGTPPAGASQTSKSAAVSPSSAPSSAISKTTRAPSESQASFVNQHSAAANEAERASGLPAGFMLGQAGHETGWGKHEIKHKGGASSHNLFGIKAGASWTGKVAEVTTTEYVNGVPQKQVARFRAYDSYADSFKDYARMISESPRYAKAREQTGSAHAFASGLQKAGYATDPDYAAKLSRAINTTLQIRRAQA
jgi:flagellar protein FlgJ